jgi:PAS domain S-box-containing protein
MPTAKSKRLRVVDSNEGAVPPSVVTSVASVSGAPDLHSKYQAIFDQASDAIMTFSSDGVIDGANQAIEEMTGYLKTELIGNSVEMLSPSISPNQGTKSAHHHGRPFTKEILATSGTYEDVVVARKDGYSRFVDLSVRSVSSGASTLTLALLRDVTAKKQMERELITKHTELRNAYLQLEKKNAELQAMQETLVQSGKMAALGELAAGIAHELNQPLQGIRGYAQELQSVALPIVVNHEHGNEVEASLREIVSNVDKMAAIIGYLRSFTRKSTEKHEMADIHHAVEEAMKMLGRQFASRGITVDRNFGKDVPLVYANPLQLEQVFINLATNARDAIEATGRGRGTIQIQTRSAGKNFVEILFKDDGAGMNERTVAKVFNPFFTTKEVGKGMGLGLSLSYGILSKLQGSIVVESELGKGACFIIRIPVDFRELA